MTDQPHSPEYLIDLASQPAGGAEEARLEAEQQAEVEEQRAVSRALSSLPDPQLTPEERRDLRRAARRAAAAESPAPPPPARRRLRRAWAWPSLAAAASLAVAVAVALNLRDLGDTANQVAEVTAAPATTAAAFAPATTAAPAAEEQSEETAMADAPSAAEPERATAAGGAADADQMAEPGPSPADSPETAAAPSQTEKAPMSDTALDDLPVLWGTDEGTWETVRELADRTKAFAAGQPDVFPMSYPEMAEYADRTGLACWDDFARQRDGERETVAFAGRAWIGEFWYEVYHLETEEPRREGEPPYLLIAFTPPDGDEADGQCRPLFATEQESEG